MDSLKKLLKQHLEVAGKRRVVMIYMNERNRAINNLISSSTRVLSDVGIAGKASSIVGGMVIVLKHWTVEHICWALNYMDFRAVAVTSAGQDGLYSPECSAVGHGKSPPSIVDYGQQLGCCGRG